MDQNNSVIMVFLRNWKKSIVGLFYFATFLIQCEMQSTTIIAQTNNEIDRTFDLLERGERELELFEQHKSVTLVVGITGSGKSTFIQWLVGKNQNLKSKELGEGTGEFIIEGGHRIGSTVLSTTLFPELVIDSKNNASIYDCPGFSDTRSSSYDIAATYFVKKVTDHVHFVKLLLTVNYPSVREGVDRVDFITLLRQTLSLVKNVEKFRDSIAIVVTKVDNTYLKGGHNLVSDETVITSIANFFRKVEKTLEEKSKLAEVSKEEKIFCSKAIKLINIFLTQRNETGYTRIQIFRRPNQEGPLKNILLLENGKKKVEKMIYEELKFTEKGHDDFGYSISDRSKNDVHNLVASINDKVALLASAIVIKVQNYYKKLMNDNDAALISSETSLNIIDGHEAERGFAIDLEKDHNTISEFATISKSIKNLKELANKTTTYIFFQLGIASCQQEVEYVALQAKYLDFLELVSGRTFTTRPRDWWNEFEKMGTYLGTYLSGLETFDRFLNNLLEKFSKYNIQKDKRKYNVANLDDWDSENKTAGIQINQNNYKQFLKKLEESNLIGFDAQVKKVQVTDFQLRKLNHILYLTLKKTWNHQCQKTGKLNIQGGYLKFSDFLDTNGKLINFCGSGKILSLNIFALDIVFIDRDLNENTMELSIIVPKLQIIGDRSINVDGASGPVQSQARSGKQSGARGFDGLPGFPGEPGGNVLAIAHTFIAGEYLNISANGGHGGQGQQGGDGIQGESGKDATISDEFHREFLRDDKLTLILSTGVVEQWRYFGKRGEKSGRGGDGGIGGFGGMAGEIKVFQLDGNSNLPHETNKQGLVGKLGEGGSGGPASRNGNNLFAGHCTVWILFIPIPTWCSEKPETSTGSAYSGPQGSAGSSQFTERKNPIPGQTFQSISEVVRNYKIYLRDNLRDYFNKTTFLEFMHKIDTNVNIQSSYNTLALIQEFQDLEQQFQSKHSQDFLPFYGSLLKRTINYASRPRITERSNSYKILLSHLYTATLSKIQILKKKFSDSNLIIDLAKYLDSIQQSITDLKNFKEKSTKLKVIKQFRETYNQNIDEKIKEAKYLIQTQVKPAIDTINIQIEQEMDTLADETIPLEEAAKEKKHELEEQKKKYQRSLVFGWLLSGLAMIGQFLGIMGTIGAAANTVLTEATTVAEPFLSPTSAILKFPDDLLEQIKSVKDHLMTFREQPFSDFKDQLNMSYADTAKYPQELNDTSATIKSILTRCEEAQNTLDYEKLKELKNEFQTQLVKKVSTLETPKTGRVEKIVNGATLVVKKIEKIIPLGKFGHEIYKKVKADNSQLEAFDTAIEEAEQEIQGIRQFRTKIYEEMIPVFTSIGKNLNSMADQMNNNSQVVLDVSQWKVQSYLKDVKLNMQQLTKGFSVERSLQRCIEKLDETITTIINIYDHIQGYQDQQQLAVYIADISSPTASDIADPALSGSMIELEKIISSNLVFEQHRTAVNALKQHVFPFAYHYLDTFRLAKSNVPQEPNYQNLVSQAVEEVKGLQLKMTEYKTSITKSDSFMRTTWFSTDYKISKPFFVWENEEYRDEISKLLSGEKVLFKANVLESAPDKDAIKFNKIGIKFNSENTTLTKEISQQLKGFSVRATHMGNSYYRFNSNLYIIASAHQKIHFSFERDEQNRRVDKNSIYDKIESGDAMLSPYAMWEIQLVPTGSDMDFTLLEKYKTMVNLELEGYGCYVTKDANISDADVENYYTVAETIIDYSRPRKRELRTPEMYLPKESRPTSVNAASENARISPWLTQLWKAILAMLVYNFLSDLFTD